jgi:hypothetical protein
MPGTSVSCATVRTERTKDTVYPSTGRPVDDTVTGSAGIIFKDSIDFAYLLEEIGLHSAA